MELVAITNKVFTGESLAGTYTVDEFNQLVDQVIKPATADKSFIDLSDPLPFQTSMAGIKTIRAVCCYKHAFYKVEGSNVRGVTITNVDKIAIRDVFFPK